MLLIASRAQGIDAIMAVFGHRHHLIQAAICTSPPLLRGCGHTHFARCYSSKRIRIVTLDLGRRSQYMHPSQLRPVAQRLHRLNSHNSLLNSSVRVRCLAKATGFEGESDRAMAPPDVADLAMRARLAISPEESSEFEESLKRIVDWFGQLQDIDVDGVPPLLRVGEPSETTYRPDQPENFPERQAMLAQAPDMEGPFLRVPKVLNDGSGDG